MTRGRSKQRREVNEPGDNMDREVLQELLSTGRVVTVLVLACQRASYLQNRVTTWPQEPAGDVTAPRPLQEQRELRDKGLVTVTSIIYLTEVCDGQNLMDLKPKRPPNRTRFSLMMWISGPAALVLLFLIILCRRHKVALTSRRVENLNTCHCFNYVYMRVYICRRRSEKSR